MKIRGFEYWTSKYFLDFAEDFRFMKMKARRVMGWLEGAAESLLSADTSKQDIRTAIEQFHLQKSILHLLQSDQHL